MKQQAWLFLWFFIGMFTYMLKRGYYLITGSNPIANSWHQFFQRCWVPLLVRFVIESVIYWASFTGQLVAMALEHFGLVKYASAVGLITQFAPMAFFFGLGVDVIVDFLVSKTPFLKDFLPQMPGPLPPPVPAPPPNNP